MNATVKEMVRQDIQGNHKNPKLSEVKEIVHICKEVHRKYGIGQANGNLGACLDRV